MGTIAGAVTGVIAILSTIQRALSSVGNEAVAGVIADVIGLLYTILANATFLATAFTWEANQDLSFFAHGENIEMFGDVVLWTMVVVDTLIAGVIGWITIQSENPLVYLFGWADAVVLLSSAAALGLVAEDSLNRQENAIGYGATFT